MDTLPRLIGASRSTMTLDGYSLAADDVLAAADAAGNSLHQAGFRRGDGLVVVDDGPLLTTLATVIGAWGAGIHVAITSASGAADGLTALLHATGARLETDPADPDAVGADLTGAHPDDIAWDVASSGTTGNPKVVGFSHAAICSNVRGIADRLGLEPSDHVYTPLPLSLPGVLGMAVLPAMLVGADVTVSRHDGTEVLRAKAEMERVRPSVVYGVPYLFDVLSRGSALDGTNRLRLLLSSSAPMPAETFDRIRAAFGTPPRSSYCSAEAATVSICDGEDLDELRHGCGRPLPGVLVTTEPDGDHPGRLVVSGTSLGSGYWRDGALEAFPGTRSFTTNDVGVVNDGRLYVRSRTDDVIQVAGRNVDLARVRKVLAQSPETGEHAVVVEDDPKLGTVPVLLVVDGTTSMGAREILDACRALLTPWEAPRRVHFVSEIPRSASGKVRHVLAEVRRG